MPITELPDIVELPDDGVVQNLNPTIEYGGESLMLPPIVPSGQPRPVRPMTSGDVGYNGFFGGAVQLPMFTEPQSVQQGLYNLGAKTLSAATSPLAAILGPLSRVQALQKPISLGLAGLGGKGVYDIAQQPKPITPGGVTERIGDVLLNLLMMVPGLRLLSGRPVPPVDINNLRNITPAQVGPPPKALPLQTGRFIEKSTAGPRVYDEPSSTTFVAGPTGAAQVPLSVAEQYQVQQSRPIAGLLPAPPTQAGPTTLAQTLRNIAAQLEGRDVEPPPPNAYQGALPPKAPPPVAPDVSPLQSDIARFAELTAKSRAMIADRSAFVPGSFNQTPEFLGIQQEIENIKNKYVTGGRTGMPPNETSTLAAPGQEVNLRSPNAISELRTGELPQTQPPGDLPPVGQEIRPGATKEGVARQGQVAKQKEPAEPLAGEFFTYQAANILTERFPKAESKIERQQMVNTLRNKLGEKSSEWQMWKDLGIEKASVETPKALAEWMKENGPKVEIRAKGMEIKLHPDQKAFLDFQHSWFDNLSEDRQRDVLANNERGVPLPSYWSEADRIDAKHYHELFQKSRAIPYDPFQSETANWSSVAPKPEPELRDYVEIALVKSRKPISFEEYQRQFGSGDLTKDKTEYQEHVKSGQANVHELTQFPSTHSFPPNTIVFDRLYMETGANLKKYNPGRFENVKDDEKVAFIIEAQSDWAQKVREDNESLKTYGDNPPSYEVESRNRQNDPLLAHYERLALKAAIEHARAQGATRIAVQDAESAMMTEGHDRLAKAVRKVTPEQMIKRHVEKYASSPSQASMELERGFGSDWTKGTYASFDDQFIRVDQPEKNRIGDREERLGQELYNLYEGGKTLPTEDTFQVAQEQGMRLHYDRTLPKILEELTGKKGEKVSFGEHKMAVEPYKVDLVPSNRPKLREYIENNVTFKDESDPLYKWVYSDSQTTYRIGNEAAKTMLGDIAFKSIPREDLIFRNPDGTPKTDVTALMFDISKPAARRATGEPMTTHGKLYSVPGMFFDVDFWAETAKGVKKMVQDVNKPPQGQVYSGVQKLKSYAEEKAEANTPFGIGKVPGLSRLFDPRSYRTTPVEKALHAHEYQVFKGKQMAALWLESRREVPRAFNVDKKTGQVALGGGMKGYLSDMVEAEMRSPGSQALTPLQKQFVQWWKKQLATINEELREEGVEYFEDDAGDVVKVGDAYFPRPAVGKRGVEGGGVGRTIQRVVGAKRFFQHRRQYATEKAGVEEGKIIYEPDEYARVGRYLEAAYRAIADKRLSKDPDLAGEKGPEKFMETSHVYHPAFRSRLFTKEVAEKINNYYTRQPGRVLKGAGNVNDFLKSVQFTADVSTPLNQGLMMLGVAPGRWSKATLLSYKALFSDKVMSQYINKPENLRVAQDIVANGGSGGSVSYLYDFLQGARKGRLAENIPPIRASARSMTTFLAIAKIELYKAFEPIAKKKGATKAELVEAVENMVLSGRMESIGLTPERALAERLLFNAPSYIRAAVNIPAMVANGGLQRRVAIRALIGLATVLLLTQFILGRKEVEEGELTEEEFRKRFDPREPKFMRIPLDYASTNISDRIEFSYGNIFLTLLRKAGQIADEPAKAGELGPRNPGISFATSRLSPGLQLGKQIVTGEDYRGEPMSAGKLAKNLLPVSLQSGTEHETFSKPWWAAVTASTAGGQTYPESFTDKRMRALNAEAQKSYSKPYNELTAGERVRVEDTVAKTLPRTKPTAGQISRAIESQQKVATAVYEGLDEPVRDKLDELGLEVPGYRSFRTVGGHEYRLADDAERELFQEALVKESNRRLRNVLANERFTTLSQKQQQELVDKVIAAARTQAWNEVEKSVKDRRSSRQAPLVPAK